MQAPTSGTPQHTHAIAGSRVLAIDAFRGITILIMIFVNSLAGVRGMPAWMDHMPGDVDGMTFVDVVFPAFLFIVGMSIPFAFAGREKDGFWATQQHMLTRAGALIVLGVFMVNAEEGYNEAAMHMSIHIWSLLFYTCAVLVWSVYRFRNPALGTLLRVVGAVGLVVLGVLYRGGTDGELRLAPQWWGILGLIGWAYLYSCIIYQLSGARKLVIALTIAACILYYCLGHSNTAQQSIWFGQTENAAHTSIALAGLVCSLIFFDQATNRSVRQRYLLAGGLCVALLVAGALLHHYFIISKIEATPPWCLFSSAICIALFGLLYWLIDLKQWQAWVRVFKPAANNPLLTYIIPYIVYAATEALHLPIPEIFQQGLPGMLRCIVYALLVIAVVAGLNRFKIRLKL